MSRTLVSKLLGIDLAAVRVEAPDTASNLAFAGVASQRTTLDIGGAIENACNELIGLLVAERGPGWRFAAGSLSGPGGQSMPMADALVQRAGLEIVGRAPEPLGAPDPHFGFVRHWAPSATAVEVEVDTVTGEVTVPALALAIDAGSAVNLAAVEGQARGGAIMGLGQALHERVHYDDAGQIALGAFAYRLPAMGDVPAQFTCYVHQTGDGPGPGGAKAVAQTSIVTVAPAIAQAIEDAVGIRMTELPITADGIISAAKAL